MGLLVASRLEKRIRSVGDFVFYTLTLLLLYNLCLYANLSR